MTVQKPRIIAKRHWSERHKAYVCVVYSLEGKNEETGSVTVLDVSKESTVTEAKKWCDQAFEACVKQRDYQFFTRPYESVKRPPENA